MKDRNGFNHFRHNSFKVMSQVILDLLESLGTSRALALAISFRYSSFKSVDESLLELNPFDYDQTQTMLFQYNLQAIAFFKKSMYLEVSNDREEEAVAKFLEIERHHQVFNSKPYTYKANGVLYTASRIIRNILGDVPEIEDLKVSFPPGATFSLRASDATFAAKLSNRLDVTTHALPYLLRLLGTEPLLGNTYKSLGITIVPGNKFSTVPKDYRKHRTICKEPLGNMLLQKGFGSYMKNRLKRVGIFIETGQSDHQALLRHDADAWATIDQSDASCMISDTLVRSLLPYDWYAVLNAIRSRKTSINGTWIDSRRFMTQGNGFTFELETIIFYALAQAIAVIESGRKQPICVYGDDIIVPIHLGMCVAETLPLFGLKVNTEKSFTKGSFKESCGFDIFYNTPVRPLYLKEFEHEETLFYSTLCNYIYRVSRNITFSIYDDPIMQRAWRRCLSAIPLDKRFYVPESLGDLGIITRERPEHYKGAYWRDSVLYCKVYKRKYSTRCFIKPIGEYGELAYALLGGSSNGTLKRNARFKLASARACPVNWA